MIKFKRQNIYQLSRENGNYFLHDITRQTTIGRLVNMANANNLNADQLKKILKCYFDILINKMIIEE